MISEWFFWGEGEEGGVEDGCARAYSLRASRTSKPSYLVYEACADPSPRWPAFTAAITFELFKRDPVAQGGSIMQTILSPFRASPAPEHCEWLSLRLSRPYCSLWLSSYPY